MEPLLAIAAELEARDAVVAAELTRVEAEQAEVESLRARAAAAAEMRAWLPQAVSENEYALHQAVRARDEAAAAVASTDDDSRTAAESALAAAQIQVARLREHRDAFAGQEAATRLEVERLVEAVGGSDLDDALEVLSQRRGALLVERSSLAREREAVVREASEVLAAATGDPFASTSVAGLRARLT